MLFEILLGNNFIACGFCNGLNKTPIKEGWNK